MPVSDPRNLPIFNTTKMSLRYPLTGEEVIPHYLTDYIDADILGDMATLMRVPKKLDNIPVMKDILRTLARKLKTRVLRVQSIKVGGSEKFTVEKILRRLLDSLTKYYNYLVSIQLTHVKAQRALQQYMMEKFRDKWIKDIKIARRKAEVIKSYVDDDEKIKRLAYSLLLRQKVASDHQRQMFQMYTPSQGTMMGPQMPVTGRAF